MRLVVSQTRNKLVGWAAVDTKWHAQFRHLLDQERCAFPSGDDIVRRCRRLAHIIFSCIWRIYHQEYVIFKPGNGRHYSRLVTEFTMSNNGPTYHDNRLPGQKGGVLRPFGYRQELVELLSHLQDQPQAVSLCYSNIRSLLRS